MEKHIRIDKYNSFSKSPQSASHSDDKSDHNRHHRGEIDQENDELDRTRISQDVDQYTKSLSSKSSSSDLPEAPYSIKRFIKIFGSRIVRYNDIKDDEERLMSAESDSFFVEDVRMMAKLSNAMSDFPSHADDENSSLLDQMTVLLQGAMTVLEKIFQIHLHGGVDPDQSQDSSAVINSQGLRKVSSFSSKSSLSQQEHGYSDRCVIQRDDDDSEYRDFPGFSHEVLMKLQKIASVMIFSGYETECLQVYFIARRDAIKLEMDKLEFCNKINMDDVVTMSWESLESEISLWIKVVKHFSQVILPEEKKLGEVIFSDFPDIFKSLYGNIVRIVVIQLLDFAEATSMAKRSAEKLFRYLDMYETLRQGLIPCINDLSLSSSNDLLINEVTSAVDRIGESAAKIFCDLENSIMSDATRTSVPGGAVHPLTRYVMNYLMNACEYRETLESIFEKHCSMLENRTESLSPSTHDPTNNDSPRDQDTIAASTPFSSEVVRIMTVLDSYLETRSKLYTNPSLQYIFLMNNARYVLQKVKGCDKIRQLMGDNWCRKRSTIVRQYHTMYQRDTCSKVLGFLNPKSLQVKLGSYNSNKVDKTMLKEQFKNFTNTFEEIHRTQSCWIVSDEQLRLELRMSISGVIVPAYRSFVGRYKNYFEVGRVDKYIKYQPEDVEALIEGLFEGNSASSMLRTRT